LLFIYFLVLCCTWRFGHEDCFFGFVSTLFAGIPIAVTIVVQWLRAVDFVYYSWWTAQVIWWIFYGIFFPLLILGTIMTIYSYIDGSGEFYLFFMMCVFSWGFLLPMLATTVLYCHNFENMLRDKPIWPWILTFSPLVFLEAEVVVALIGFDIWYKFFS